MEREGSGFFFFQFHTIGHKSPHCVNFGNYNSPWCVWGLCSPFPHMIREGSYIHQRSAEWPLQLSVFYRPQTKLWKGSLMVSQACVKNSAQGGRYTPPRQTHTPLGRHPLGRHPPGQITRPPSRQPLQRMVHILLECILVLILKHVCWHFQETLFIISNI